MNIQIKKQMTLEIIIVMYNIGENDRFGALGLYNKHNRH